MGGEEEMRGSEEELREPLLDEYELLDREEVEEAVQAVSPQQNRNKQTTEAPLRGAPPPALAIWQAVVAALLKAWLYGLGALRRWLASLRAWADAWRRPQLSLVQEERLGELRKRIAVPYDAELEEHRAALMQLWEAAFPEHAFPKGIRSAQWKQMGWQGEDPATDFRGGGFLALESLLFLARSEPESFSLLMHKMQGVRSEYEYPFAVAGVNVAFMLTDALDLRHESRVPSTASGRAFLALLAESDRAFEEVWVACFLLLDRVWLETGATYMEFPQVIREVQRRLHCVLVRRSGSVRELRELLLQ